jgi:hypothetical protein
VLKEEAARQIKAAIERAERGGDESGPEKAEDRWFDKKEDFALALLTIGGAAIAAEREHRKAKAKK